VQTQPPFIVNITEPPEDPNGFGALADVLLGSLGLTGVIALFAIVAGAIVGVLMFWVRSRSA